MLTLLLRGSHGFLFGSLLSVADECSSIRGQWTVVTLSRAPPCPRPRAMHGTSLAFIPTGPSGFDFFFTNEGTRTIVTVFPATGWQSQDQTSPSLQSPHCLCVRMLAEALSSRLLQGVAVPMVACRLQSALSRLGSHACKSYMCFGFRSRAYLGQ